MATMTVGERDPASKKKRKPYLLGPRLVAARKALGLTQRAAARRADISNMTLNMLERGVYRRGGEDVPVTDPKLESVLKAARAVGIDPAEAIKLAGIENDVPTDAYEPPLSITDEQLARKTARLTPEQQRTFRRVANDILDMMLHPHGRAEATIASGPEEFATADIKSGPTETAAGVLADDGGLDSLGSQSS